jgi:hypothetical protein
MAQVRLYFNDGANQYTFPCVQSVSDPKEGMKATVIEGTRGDGAIIIPGGKRSQEIRISGVIVDNDGYTDITTEMNNMRSKVTTNVATLSLQHYTGGTWVNDWSYTVRRIDEITFADSLRIIDQEYEVRFMVLSY